MLVAIGTFEMHFPEVHSLKEKRQILNTGGIKNIGNYLSDAA